MALLTGWVVSEYFCAICFTCSTVYRTVVSNIYEQKKELKAQGDPSEQVCCATHLCPVAHLVSSTQVLKLVLNSFYGKNNQKSSPVYRFGTRAEVLGLLETLLHTVVPVSKDGRYFRARLSKKKEFETPSQIGVMTLSAGRFLMHWMNLKVGLFSDSV